MKIALVTPHPVPLALGGAENLWWGLQQHFEEETEHRCDIISVMAPESNFWDLVSSYETFSKLDLSAYDCVISGKYPGWMVKHPNHVCYMLHRLRGLYDTYPASQHHPDILKHPRLGNLAEWLEDGIANPDPDQIPELFDRLRSLRKMDLPPEVTAFPGAFSRAVIHFLDNAALSPMRIQRYAAISATVARRKSYFPPDMPVDVLYPPPHRDNYSCGKSQYFFTSSRLDRPKRIHLLIEAMKSVKGDIPLLIAGTGPDEARLKAVAGEDPRIRFLGYVADDAMPGLYADARAVPFIPVDEDYGLITIEAMKSGKPVLTALDSGGPCEFVVQGKTGFVSKPHPAALGEWLNRLAVDEEEAVALGQAAREKVSTIRWDMVAQGLLEVSAPHVKTRIIRPKITVATAFKVYPPMNGGQSRVFHLYRNLAKTYDVDLVTLSAVGDVRHEAEIAPGLMEISIPRSQAHAQVEYEVSRLVDHKPVSDVTTNALLGLTPDYSEALKLSAMTSRVVIACHPFMVDWLKRAAPDKSFWYEAQDVEKTLKTAVFGDLPQAGSLLREVEMAERDCWITAERVFACANRDLQALESLYGPTRARLSEVPNGVSLDDVAYTPLGERRRLQGIGGISGRQLAIFMGSWHGPNLEAVEDLILQAPDCPQTRFVILGSVCLPFKDRRLPDNMEMMGAVDMRTRDLMLSIADIALNPMRSGTGTNLKMLDYMAAGVPVISTEFGARGLTITNGEHFLCAPTSDLPAALAIMADMGETELEALIVAARSRVEEDYSWSVIADRFLEEIAQSA
ncbi:glycosyltransferase [Agrobacterium genomosp. 3]|uniref:glycosyltransferase n=1 Tax=Agrobacterium tomkonis TaxID=1183410 RepID=UPI001CD87BF4|nr:glycosyltransferase [Agrobacterium tomkonis]MCA1879516.1 glycosyltransferase [Agrobacterium tumefaciens]MCA1894734.1 glycosyltransferase [Agrobacterium tomkonis]